MEQCDHQITTDMTKGLERLLDRSLQADQTEEIIMVCWKNQRFYVNDQELEIHSGAIHYFRSFPERWRELLLKLKNCGMNTVETYCAWNLHEPAPGEFDFSGEKDLVKFIRLAQELGLYVILRPGPYICAEWEFGGFPAWMLNKVKHFRTREGEYLIYVRRYFEQLIPKVVPLLETNGGPIILMAAENEYGSFGSDTAYMNQCVQMLKELGVDVPIFTSDGHTMMFLRGGHADGTLCALDYGYMQGKLREDQHLGLHLMQPDAPVLNVEHWDGYLSHWGKPLRQYDAELLAGEVADHLRQHDSFSLYMFHGGTNFGFFNGANNFFETASNRGKQTYYADVTSYDYGAPLTEWGEITPKYLAVKREMEAHLRTTFPVPEPVPLMSLGDISLTQSAELFEGLERIGTHHFAVCPPTMEELGQCYGYILYRTRITPKNGIRLLTLRGVGDRANIYFNGVWRGVIYRNDDEKCLEVNGWMEEGGVLDILVENMGRINFGVDMDMGDPKGLTAGAYVTGVPTQMLKDFDVYTLPMENLQELVWKTARQGSAHNRPMFYKGTFRAAEQKDCFVHLDGFDKGFVVINGFNLGRYWEIGPQRSLYIPREILKEENEVIVFAEHPVDDPVISILDRHILDSLKTDELPVTIV